MLKCVWCVLLISTVKLGRSQDTASHDVPNILYAELCASVPMFSINYEREAAREGAAAVNLRIGVGFGKGLAVPHGFVSTVNVLKPLRFELGLSGVYELYQVETNVGTHSYDYSMRSGYVIVPSVGLRLQANRRGPMMRATYTRALHITGDFGKKEKLPGISFAAGYVF